MKRILVPLLVACLAVGLIGSAYAGVAFSDTAGDPSEAAIIKLAALGIIKGSASGSGIVFRPQDNITRTEFAILMLRALGREREATAITTKPAFTDVGTSYRWAWGYISLAAQDGIIKGSEGKFRPGDKVTHGEALTMLVRALGREPMVDSKLPWPDGHVNLAEQLGVDAVSYLPSAYATRSNVAEYLSTVFTTPLLKWDSLKIVPTQDSFLSLQGGTEITVEITAASPAGVSPAWIECPDGSVLPDDADSADDRIVLAADATLYGADGVSGLSGRIADLIVGATGKLIYAAPVVRVSGIVAQMRWPQVVFTNGASITVNGTPSFRANGFATFVASAPLLITPGTYVEFEFDPKNSSRMTDINLVAPMGGILQFANGCYSISAFDETIRVWPEDPAGWIVPGTQYLVNEAIVDEKTMESELGGPGRLCIGMIMMDVSGKMVVMGAAVFDGPGTFAQPMVARTGDGFEIPRLIDTPTDTESFVLAPDVAIHRDNEDASLSDLMRGDLLSFRTNSSGQVTFLLAQSDTTAPTIVGHVAEKNCVDRDWIDFDEALDPSTISVTVDGTPYSLSPTTDSAGDGNTFIQMYQPWNVADGDRMTLMLWPRLDFSDGLHTITVTGCDYAGNRMQQTLTSEYDTTPAKAQSITFNSDGTVVKITFDDNMDGASITSLNHWFCPARGENGASEARYDAATRTLTLVMKSGFRGVTVVSEKLADAAGNTVDVTFTTPK